MKLDANFLPMHRGDNIICNRCVMPVSGEHGGGCKKERLSKFTNIKHIEHLKALLEKDKNVFHLNKEELKDIQEQCKRQGSNYNKTTEYMKEYSFRVLLINVKTECSVGYTSSKLKTILG